MHKRSLHWWSGLVILLLQVFAGVFLIQRAAKEPIQAAEVVAVFLGLITFTAAIIFVATQMHWKLMRVLTDTARQFGRGDLRGRIRPPGFVDHNNLAEALNRMANLLDDRMHQLRTDQLEQQALMESIASGIIAVNHEQRILNSNEATSSILGLLARKDSIG